MKILLCMLLLGVAVPVAAQDEDPHTTLFRASMAAAVVAHSMDLAETAAIAINVATSALFTGIAIHNSRAGQ